MSEKKSMKFLLLPKEGKPRFSSKDPWEYIKSKGLQPINDWVGFRDDLDKRDELDPLYSLDIDTLEGIKLDIIFLSPDGKKEWASNINNNAETFCKAYCNYLEDIRENLVIILKEYNSKDNSFKNFTNKDIYIIRRMLKDAFRWFS